ncbi:hypothetical protein D9757_007587 [Collybiopsis confluens]|uniref:Kinase-like protein n=1 Tax=Collybiopsis confluens TaxID=2823264 RepID=A0A8H5HEV7_9AGAR|nr:hypothetical protein D9757_007587 [Collybiopsis confluens]
MYHLLKGFHQHLTRKDEFSVIIVGLDGAGKTTLLEQIKTLYNDTPGLPPDKIGPTVGQNTGKITLPSTILQFWDLGGQRGIRNIWHKYYDDCHAVVYVIDADDRERLSEGWDVFDSVLSSPQILNLPLLLLANKQDTLNSLSVDEIRNDYEDWYQRKIESARRSDRYEDSSRKERIASLDVMGVSAIKGTGVRAAVDWLFIRVQNRSSLSSPPPSSEVTFLTHPVIPSKMHSDAFDVIPFEDIEGDWKTLGSGSFGKVYKGTYLGIDVAIKEVIPSNEYDVAKYFEREWRLMKESRHPNIVLFIGLSRAPEPDNRIFIVSEFIDNGNLRHYIHDKSKPFPWRMRLSFATDIARALAYLHARKCIHRDLKGENLLVTANGRLKITDFGFARIAARSEDESKRLTFCGTDSYMSPEILVGEEFGLPTDIFSFGIILCEIAARKLADDHHFKRAAPYFTLDADEVGHLASPGCPPELITLCMECCSADPAARPTTRQILDRLRIIEAEVLSRPNEGQDVNVGSIKFITGHKRPAPQPRIPSFGVGVGKNIRTSGFTTDESDDSDDELMEAVQGLSGFGLSSNGSHDPLLGNTSALAEYSTTVVRATHSTISTQPPSLSSILTIRASPDPNTTPDPVLPASPNASTIMADHPSNGSDLLGHSSILSIDSLDSYHTAAGSAISSAMATEGGSTVRTLHGNFTSPLVHRFSILKPGAKPTPRKGVNGTATPPNGPVAEPLIGWNPFDLFFSSASMTSKCDICSKRFGPWKPILECDDCGLKAHVKCGDDAPRDCGVRPSRPRVHHQSSHSLGTKLKFGKATTTDKDKSPSPPR